MVLNTSDISWELKEKAHIWFTYTHRKIINWRGEFGEESSYCYWLSISYCYFKNFLWVLKCNQRWTLDGLAGKDFLKNSLADLSCTVQTTVSMLKLFFNRINVAYSGCVESLELLWWQGKETILRNKARRGSSQWNYLLDQL